MPKAETVPGRGSVSGARRASEGLLDTGREVEVELSVRVLREDGTVRRSA